MLWAQALESHRNYNTLQDPCIRSARPDYERNVSDGDRYLRSLMAALALFDRTEKWKRSEQQAEIHQLYAMACAPQIYGEEYAMKAPEVLRYFCTSHIKERVALFAGRGAGKTIAIGMFCAAFMWTQKYTVISVFSNAARASTMLADKVELFLELLEEHDEQKLQMGRNQKRIWCINPLGHRSTLYPYPCSDIRFPPIPSPHVCVCVCVCTFRSIVILCVCWNAWVYHGWIEFLHDEQKN